MSGRGHLCSPNTSRELYKDCLGRRSPHFKLLTALPRSGDIVPMNESTGTPSFVFMLQSLQPPSTVLTTASPCTPQACCAFPCRISQPGAEQTSKMATAFLKNPSSTHLQSLHWMYTRTTTAPLSRRHLALWTCAQSYRYPWVGDAKRQTSYPSSPKERHLGMSHLTSQACLGAALIKAKLQTLISSKAAG